VLISLAELERHRIVASKTYASGRLDYHGADFRQAAPLEVTATAELVGTEIRIRGHLKTRLSAQCDRCLAPIEIPLDRDFDVIYRPSASLVRGREEEIEVPKDELEVGFFSGDGVELAEIVTEQVILSVPMKVVCREDCKGLCPSCGADMNRAACQCSARQKTGEVSPFERLK
jgi:DUF177 domain-containing protein